MSSVSFVTPWTILTVTRKKKRPRKGIRRYIHDIREAKRDVKWSAENQETETGDEGSFGMQKPTDIQLGKEEPFSGVRRAEGRG